MHRTLNDATARPPASSLPAQQQRFDEFREIYNAQRPHEALGQKTPASRYAPSPRAYPQRLDEPNYDGEVAVRRVRSTGQIKWAGELVFVGEALIGEPVGILETESGDGWCASPMSNWATSIRNDAGSVRGRCSAPIGLWI